jgi:ABC-type sugar transport system ATPase subunit
MNGPLLQMVGMTKEFRGGRVLHNVNFSLARGEVCALVGQNGAGKSTLMKILGGVYRDYGGSVEIDGNRVTLHDPRSAIAVGVAIIYQDFTLVPHLTVAENIALGREPCGRLPGTIDHRRLGRSSQREAADLGIELPMSWPVAKLGVAAQQLTEIVKAVSRHAKILVMDEPTARLSARERDRLFGIIRDLTHAGVGVVYISHFLEEVFEISDRVTVLRDGRVVGQYRTKDLDLASLTQLMTGTRYYGGPQRRKSSAEPTKRALQLKQFGVRGRVGPIDLDVAFGEIVGFAGLVGAGRTTLVKAIAGAARGAVGSVVTPHRTGLPRTPIEAEAAGILLVTEDRKRGGIAGVRSVAENIALTALNRSLCFRGLVRPRQRLKLVSRMISRLNIVPKNPNIQVSRLSGGNQQKVVLARAIAANTDILILDQPTAGVDVGAKADLYEQIDQLAREGVTILLVSDDLEELLNLSDRIVVIRRGQIVTIRRSTDFDRQTLLQAITAGVLAQLGAAK